MSNWTKPYDTQGKQMKNLDIRTWLAIGGLLHDIGKLIDRTGEVRADEREKEEFKYAHAVYSYKFLEKLLEGKVTKEVEDLILSGPYHHNPKPNNPYHLAQQMADHCASSERSQRQEQGITISTQRREEKRLKSIFALVEVKGAKGSCAEGYIDREKYEYNLRALELKRDIMFPTETTAVSKESGRQEYQNLFKALEGHLRSLDFKDLQKTLIKLYYLLYKYLWCVPASTYDKERGTNHFADISLFDHLRVASAIVSSLWTDYNKQRLKDGLNAVEFLLIEGDITGIQKFLYQLSNVDGVGKRLRGRSFFISVVPLILGRFFLKELEYPMVNLLYAGGGKFQLIIGYEEGIEQKLEELQRRVDEVLVKEFGGHLGVILGWMRFKGTELRIGVLGEKIHELYEEVRRRKFQKFSTILNNFDSLANTFVHDKYEICPSCQTSLKSESQEFCNWCEQFQKVGGEIPRAEYVVFSPERGDLYLEGIGGVSVYSKNQVPHTLPEDTLLLLNSTEFEDKADGFFFLANTVPLKEDGSVKDFKELVEEEEIGYKLLAFVKVDVDNLGLIFSQGLKEDYSLSRVATLSRSLELFFSGYINTFLAKKEFKNKVYMVYSGGDDLFFCAPWEIALEVAKELENEFSAYTCYNPCFTLSAGVFFQRPNYPIRFAADGAEQEKENAKLEKNCISLWENPLPWDKFAHALDELKHFLANFDATNHRTLLYRIYTLLRSYKKDRKINMKFYPMFYYQLHRNLKREEDQRELEALILDPNNNYNLRDYAEIILKLVLMETRNTSGKIK